MVRSRAFAWLLVLLPLLLTSLLLATPASAYRIADYAHQFANETLVTVASEERNENSSLEKLENQLDARVSVTGLSVEPMENSQTYSAQGTTPILEKAQLMSDVSSGVKVSNDTGTKTVLREARKQMSQGEKIEWLSDKDDEEENEEDDDDDDDDKEDKEEEDEDDDKDDDDDDTEDDEEKANEKKQKEKEGKEKEKEKEKKEKNEKEEKEKEGKNDEGKDEDDDKKDDGKEEEEQNKQQEKEEQANEKEKEKEKEEKENEDKAGKVQEEGNENGTKNTTYTPTATVNEKEDGAESTQQAIKPTTEEVKSTTITNSLSPDFNKSNKDTESVKQPSVLPVTENIGETEPSIPVGSPMLTTPIISRQSTEESPKSDGITPSTEEAQTEAADHTFTVSVEISDDLGTSGKPADLPVSENTDEAPASTPVMSSMLPTPTASGQSKEENREWDEVPSITVEGQIGATGDPISATSVWYDMGTSVESIDLKESKNVTETTPVVSSMFTTLMISAQSAEQEPKSEDITTGTMGLQFGLAGNLSTSSVEMSYDMGSSEEPTAVTDPERIKEATIPYSVSGTPTMPAHSQSDGATPSTVDEQTETIGIVSAGPMEFSDATGSTVEFIDTLIWVDAKETTSAPAVAHSISIGDHLPGSPITSTEGFESTIGSIDTTGSESAEQATASTPVTHSMLATLGISAQPAEEELSSENITGSTVGMQVEVTDNLSTSLAVGSGENGSSVEPTDFAGSEKTEVASASTTFAHSMTTTVTAAHHSIRPLTSSQGLQSMMGHTSITGSESGEEVSAPTTAAHAMPTTLAISAQSQEQKLNSEDIAAGTVGMEVGVSENPSTSSFETSGELGSSSEPTNFTGTEVAEEASTPITAAHAMSTTPAISAKSTKGKVTSEDMTAGTVGMEKGASGNLSTSPPEMSVDMGSWAEHTNFTGSKKNEEASASTTVGHSMPTTVTTAHHPIRHVTSSEGLGSTMGHTSSTGSNIDEKASASTTAAQSMSATLAISAQSTQENVKSDDITAITVGIQFGVAGNLSTSSVRMSSDIGSSSEPTDFTSSEVAEEASASTAVAHSMITSPTITGQSSEQNLKSDDNTSSTAKMQTETADHSSEIPLEMADGRGTTIEPTDWALTETGGEVPASTLAISSMLTSPTASGQSTEENLNWGDVSPSTQKGQTEEPSVIHSFAHTLPGTPTMPVYSTEKSVSSQSEQITPSKVDEQTDANETVSAGSAELSDAIGSTVEPVDTAISGKAKETTSLPTVAHSIPTELPDSTESVEQSVTLKSKAGSPSTVDGLKGDHLPVSPSELWRALESTMGPIATTGSESDKQAATSSTTAASSISANLAILAQSTKQKDHKASTVKMQFGLAGNLSTSSVAESQELTSSEELTDNFAGSENAEEASASPSLAHSMPATATEDQLAISPVTFLEALGSTITPIVTKGPESAKPVTAHSISATLAISAQSTTKKVRSQGSTASTMEMKFGVAGNLSTSSVVGSDETGSSAEPTHSMSPESAAEAALFYSLQDKPTIPVQSKEDNGNDPVEFSDAIGPPVESANRPIWEEASEPSLSPTVVDLIPAGDYLPVAPIGSFNDLGSTTVPRGSESAAQATASTPVATSMSDENTTLPPATGQSVISSADALKAHTTSTPTAHKMDISTVSPSSTGEGKKIEQPTLALQ